MLKTPHRPSGMGYVVVVVAAVLAALGVIHMETQGLTEHTRQLTGIRTSTPALAGARNATQPQERQGSLLPVVNLAPAK